MCIEEGEYVLRCMYIEELISLVASKSRIVAVPIFLHFAHLVA